MIFVQKKLSQFPPEGVVERRIIGIKLEATGGRGELRRLLLPHISQNWIQHISFGDCFALPEELQDWVGAAPPSFSELQHRGRQGLLGGAYDKDGGCE